MKKYMTLVVLMVASYPMFAQGRANKLTPDEQIKVNKEYDESGNLIRYDSSYVKSWSSDSTFYLTEINSIREEMERVFGRDMNRFFSDSASSNNFDFPGFNEHFFQSRQDFINLFSQEAVDSTLDSLFVFDPNFGNFEKLNDELQARFNCFFEDDSIDTYLNQLLKDGYLTSPDEDDVDQLREKLEPYFNQKK